MKKEKNKVKTSSSATAELNAGFLSIVRTDTRERLHALLD